MFVGGATGGFFFGAGEGFGAGGGLLPERLGAGGGSLPLRGGGGLGGFGAFFMRGAAGAYPWSSNKVAGGGVRGAGRRAERRTAIQHSIPILIERIRFHKYYLTPHHSQNERKS